MKISPIQSTILDTLSSLWTQLQAALLIPVNYKKTEASHGESDFDGCVPSSVVVGTTANSWSLVSDTGAGFGSSTSVCHSVAEPLN